MSKVLIFSGTGDGRELAEILAEAGHEVIVCVATEYGEQVMPSNSNIKVHCGRMDEAHMYAFFASCNMDVVIDATHPYAKIVSENIKRVCKNKKYEYYRLLRDSVEYESDENITVVPDIISAAKFVAGKSGNVFMSTGSKELKAFADNIDDIERVYVRVLPSADVLEEITKLGLVGRQIICMQGPFSENLNYEMFASTNAQFLVTKDSGKMGGFEEKINAAKRAKMQVVVIKRPDESGLSLTTILSKFGIGYKKCPGRKAITLAGIGMGSRASMTYEVIRAIEGADVIIGADRMLEAANLINKNARQISLFKSEEIVRTVLELNETNIAIVMSGDVGFYSGAKKLIESFENENIENINVLPGISTPVYMASKLNISWDDMKLVSMHGRELNIIEEIIHNEKVFVLAGGRDGVANICKLLVSNGLGEIKAYVASNLSYTNEKIVCKKASEFVDFEEMGVSAIIFINENVIAGDVTHGISDDEFIRENVPMTKEEVRCVSISKMQLKEDSVIYDIGAGTGSVSIECAKRSRKGVVYAIERKEEAISLIDRNCKKLGVTNVEIVNAYAPDIPKETEEKMLPPTNCFIGGSGGNMSEIIDWAVRKNPDVKFVINAIALETVTEVLDELKKRGIEDAQIVSLNVAKAKKVGNYNMMMGNNPVYIISFSLN